MKHVTCWLVAGALAATVPTDAEERVDAAMNWKIRQEAIDRSEILRTLHYLTDMYGPRLTGSPNLKAASDWSVKQMQAWGLENVHLEPWNFGHPGWTNERFSGHIVSPVRDALVGEVLAWTPSTEGTVTGAAVQIDLPNGPTKEELSAALEAVRATVKGKMVLVGKPRSVLVTFNKPALRRESQELRSTYDAAPTPAPVPSQQPTSPARQGPPPLTARQIAEQVDQFLVAAGALVRINDAGRDHGQIRAFNNRTFDPVKAVPTVVLRNEDYGRISRILANGTPVELEFTIVNKLHPEGTTAYNVVGEIPGSDKKDEIVMLGGHLDSWHAATGATDNAIGVATMLEVMRILKAVGAQPRRTIRVALWSGEEQGLLGSLAYVKEHFGTAENPKPAFSKFGGYFNIDSGTGRVRGATVFGPAEAATILREALAPFIDLGVVGATTTRSRRQGGSDHTAFNAAGLPGIGMQLDPIEYQTYTWHTNLDTYERIVVEDAQTSAIVVAAAVNYLAARDALLPRLGKEQMPAPAPATTAVTTTSAN
jgi:carboxypeptidase Q